MRASAEQSGYRKPPITLGTGVAEGQGTGHRRTLAIAVLAVCFAGAVWANPGQGDGHGPGGKPRKGEPPAPLPVGGYFRDEQRRAATQYYGDHHAKGRCPPGLARKGNGCMPPGQARKWQLGQTLPADVRWYPVPQEVVVRIGVPPPGYRYVRVLNDILLIAIGSRMVIDAIEDLMR